MYIFKDVHIKFLASCHLTTTPGKTNIFSLLFQDVPKFAYFSYIILLRFVTNSVSTQTGEKKIFVDHAPSLLNEEVLFSGDVDSMFRDFVPLQLGCLRQYTTLIPGTTETSKILKNEFGNKIK